MPSLTVAAPIAPSCRVLRTAGEVDALVPAWEAGIPPGPLGPLTRPAWFAAAAGTLAARDRLRVVVLRRAGAVVGVAPLVVAPTGRLELLGADVLPEPGDLSARDPDALTTLARAVVALGRPMRLARVPAASPTIAALRAAVGRSGWVATRPAEPWPTLPLGPEWATAAGGLSARRAGDLRRAARRAAAAGTVTMEDHRPGPGEVDALLDAALAVEAAGWKGATRTALIHDRTRYPFFVAWARAAARDGTLRIALLRIGGAPAAMQVAAECSGRRWIMKIGHTEDHARCSPGLLLLQHVVRDAATRGLDAVELLGTTEPWTRAWTPETGEARLLRVYPGNVAGARRLALDGGRAVVLRAAARRAAVRAEAAAREGAAR